MLVQMLYKHLLHTELLNMELYYKDLRRSVIISFHAHFFSNYCLSLKKTHIRAYSSTWNGSLASAMHFYYQRTVANQHWALPAAEKWCLYPQYTSVTPQEESS